MRITLDFVFHSNHERNLLFHLLLFAIFSQYPSSEQAEFLPKLAGLGSKDCEATLPSFLKDLHFWMLLYLVQCPCWWLFLPEGFFDWTRSQESQSQTCKTEPVKWLSKKEKKGCHLHYNVLLAFRFLNVDSNNTVREGFEEHFKIKLAKSETNISLSSWQHCRGSKC